ncbi:MAG: 1-pyrroline-5-carboxylate dehydrogenase [Bdellovibrionales bacterium RIFOXYD1_FULL_55_31]|nr:MAG: 1-pyrroline-5-carboxylate dehydrogenase [Bdellovibrionales bacterium RIFOXYD1_FULL_55_31]
MSDATIKVPAPINEPIRAYEPGSSHRESLKRKLNSMADERIEIPCFIGGAEIRTGQKKQVAMPHSHKEVLGEYHVAGVQEMKLAVEAARKAKPAWEAMKWQDRVAIFLKAADLLAGPFRDALNAATMLGQSKNVFQAEIDSACELIDFFRFNAYFYQQILEVQPISSPGTWNQMDYRPLEGFVLAVTPFNFTSIAGNLPATPALVGNTVIWKPSSTQMLSAHYIMQLFREAGLPDGVINLVPSTGPTVAETLLPMRDLAGVHFTGSTATFHSIWRTVGQNLDHYKSYPRMVGETGGKDFVFAHSSADADALAVALLRGAFEFQGQKCSAASRAYIPKSIWKKVETRLLDDLRSVKMGDPRDFRNFVNAVIDDKAFKKISGYIEHAKSSADAKILAGGKFDSTKGYFIEPTVILANRPDYKSMVEEIFGPVLTIHVYDDNKLEETLRACDEDSPYALTGAVFAQDRYAVQHISARLRHAAGNFYINDKPTGAVVGQQPFGGARASGTDDKAGSHLNLYRWLAARAIKETFVPPKDYRYPFLNAE